MKNIIGIITFLVIIVFAFSACNNGNGTHTHEWQWVVTQEGNKTTDRIETETCTKCDETKDTRLIPIFREITINLFNDTNTARVEGTLLLSDWNGSAETVENLLNTAADPDGNFDDALVLWTVFDNDNGTIVLEKNPNFSQYKVVKIGTGIIKTLYLNVGSLKTGTVDIMPAIKAMDGGYDISY